MDLGAFSVSLDVADLAASRTFYEALGFEVFGGDGEAYVMMRNGSAVLGLFVGMFEGNLLTFNPGWAQDGSDAGAFTDVREIARVAEERGLQVTQVLTPATPSGPASVALEDPDGNVVLIDQHVGPGEPT